MNVVKLRKHRGKASRQSSLFEPATLFRTHAPDEYVIPKRIQLLHPDGREQAPFPGLCSWYVWPPGGGYRREGRWVWLDSPVAQLSLMGAM